MSLTARHKKPGGFRKLVNSLETTPPDRREKILEAMRKEDPDFTAEAEESIFDFKEFAQVNDLVICEIISAFKSEPRTLALALFHSEEALVEKFKKNMPPAVAYEFRETTDGLSQVLAREQIGARFRIVAKARDLEHQRKFTLKKYSSHFDVE